MKTVECGYKFRIYPNKSQRQKLEKMFGCCRFVYNYFLAKSIADYKEMGKSNSVYDNQKLLTALKKGQDHEFLKEADSQALNGELIFLGRAYANFFAKRENYPRFKKKTNAQSYTTWVTGKQLLVNNGRIDVPKIGRIKIKQHRAIEGRVTSGTISKTCSGNYFISLTCVEHTVEQIVHTNRSIGIDLGLKSFIVTDSGDEIISPMGLKRTIDRLKREQQKLSNKQKGSANYRKQRIKIAKIHEKIANQRKDFLHKTSTQLVKNHDFIAVEDLDVKGMLQSEIEMMPKNQIRSFRRNITDVSWSELLRQLEYKSTWYGRKFVQVDRYFPSSQLCSCCGYKNVLVKDLSVRKWHCPQCGAVHDRDQNAAINILAEARRITA